MCRKRRFGQFVGHIYNNAVDTATPTKTCVSKSVKLKYFLILAPPTRQVVFQGYQSDILQQDVFNLCSINLSYAKL